jgi:hypothetical protein
VKADILEAEMRTRLRMRVVVQINPEEEGCGHWREECSPPMGQVPVPLARPPRSQDAAILVREAKGPKDQGPKHRLSFYDESAVVARDCEGLRRVLDIVRKKKNLWQATED